MTADIDAILDRELWAFVRPGWSPKHSETWQFIKQAAFDAKADNDHQPLAIATPSPSAAKVVRAAYDGDALAFDACLGAAARMIEEGHQLPDPLRQFVADYLGGFLEKPPRSKPSAEGYAERDAAIWRAVEAARASLGTYRAAHEAVAAYFLRHARDGSKHPTHAKTIKDIHAKVRAARGSSV